MKIQNAEMEFATFDANDVIATSGEKTVTLANFGDGTPDNGIISFGNNQYTYAIGEGYSVMSAMNTYFGSNSDITEETVLDFTNGNPSVSFANLIQNDLFNSDVSDYAYVNGIYEWLAKEKKFLQISQ